MAKVAIITTDTIKIARPGFDVDTADEVGLLLSLKARNYQIIQRGTVALSGWTGTNPWTASFTINFPAQQSVPEVMLFVAKNLKRYAKTGGLTSDDTWTAIDFSSNETVTSNVTTTRCTGTVKTQHRNRYVYSDTLTTERQEAVPYVCYIVFRKRMTG